MREPQFAGQTKERLSSRDAAAFISSATKDSFSIWLNQNTSEAELIANLAIARATTRLQTAKKVTRKRVTAGPALPGKLADCSSPMPIEQSYFWLKVIQPVALLNRREIEIIRRSCRCEAKFLTLGKLIPLRF